MAIYESIVFAMPAVASSPCPFLSLPHSSPSPLPSFLYLIPLLLTPISFVLVPFYPSPLPLPLIYFPRSIISSPLCLPIHFLSSYLLSSPFHLSYLISFPASPPFPFFPSPHFSPFLSSSLLLSPFLQSWAWSSNFPIGPLTWCVAWLTTREAHRIDGVKHKFYTNLC